MAVVTLGSIVFWNELLSRKTFTSLLIADFSHLELFIMHLAIIMKAVTNGNLLPSSLVPVVNFHDPILEKVKITTLQDRKY